MTSARLSEFSIITYHEIDPSACSDSEFILKVWLF